jgi:hypothetical protein
MTLCSSSGGNALPLNLRLRLAALPMAVLQAYAPVTPEPAWRNLLSSDWFQHSGKSTGKGEHLADHLFSFRVNSR